MGSSGFTKTVAELSMLVLVPQGVPLPLLAGLLSGRFDGRPDFSILVVFQNPLSSKNDLAENAKVS